jgi:hypothetical protein
MIFTKSVKKGMVSDWIFAKFRIVLVRSIGYVCGISHSRFEQHVVLGRVALLKHVWHGVVEEIESGVS